MIAPPHASPLTPPSIAAKSPRGTPIDVEAVIRLEDKVAQLRSALCESEVEEEQHVNALLKQVSKLKMEKVDLSGSVEKEHEFLYHRLSREVRTAEKEKDAAVRALAEKRRECEDTTRRCCDAWRAAMEEAISEAKSRCGLEGREVLGALDAAVKAAHERLSAGGEEEGRVRTESGCSSVVSMGAPLTEGGIGHGVGGGGGGGGIRPISY
jgi:hypothetical protein